MKQIKVILIGLLFLSGCTAIHKTTTSQESKTPTATQKAIPQEAKKETSFSHQPVKAPAQEEVQEEELVPKGIVFAKTDFQGVLKSSFVELFVESLEDPDNKFQLHIGDKSSLQKFPWEVKTIEPGYFFLELPVGKYKMSSISIPVGSTMAVEKLDVSFEVIQDKAVYLGTLQVVGTKEKIKLGGVPVIKPGFEYSVMILDESQEGFSVMKQKYPEFSADILVELMQTNTAQQQE